MATDMVTVITGTMKTGRTRSHCTKGYLEFKRYGYVFLTT